jgi:hypothetical protein
MGRIYLDFDASIHLVVADVMDCAEREAYGNPSIGYYLGARAMRFSLGLAKAVAHVRRAWIGS